MYERPDLVNPHSSEGGADQTLTIHNRRFHRSITAQKSAQWKSVRATPIRIHLLRSEKHEDCGAELWC
jgi:hypothetical protein